MTNEETAAEMRRVCFEVQTILMESDLSGSADLVLKILCVLVGSHIRTLRDRGIIPSINPTVDEAAGLIKEIARGEFDIQ